MFTTPLSIALNPLVSSVDLSEKNGYGAQVDSNKYKVGDDGSGECVGIITNGGTESGSTVQVCMGPVYAYYGGDVTVGAMVSCNASGEIIAAASGDVPIGFALQAGASGEYRKINFTGESDESVA